jgi:transcriptional regulator of acetoin/glycerol metabolism
LNLLERLAVEQPHALRNDSSLEEYLRAMRGVAEDVIDVSEPGRSADAERIAKALRATGGKLSRTARRLELPRSTLRHRIRKYQLEDLVPRD